MLKRSWGILCLAALAGIAGCSRDEEILPGERISVRDSVIGAEALGGAVQNASLPVSLGAAAANAEWTQPGGNAAHRPGHVALRSAPAPIWQVNIGAGDGKGQRITAEPVVAGGRVFAMDANAHVSAVGTNGALLWQASLVPASDPRGERSGGGLAYSGGTVFATTGYGEVVALDAATGGIRWRQRFDAPVSGPPAVTDGVVYVVARDATASALRADTGKVIWTLNATPSTAGVIGGSAPAVGPDFVVLPFSSGEIIAVRRGGGSTLWETPVMGQRRGRTWSTITDITSDPVVAGDRIFTGNQSGRTVAIAPDTGDVIWEAEEGSYGPVAVAGNAIFLVNDEGQLVRLDSATGNTVWSVAMPHYIEAKEKNRAAIFVHYGPILAGGSLLLASSDGMIRSFNPANGALVAEVPLPGGAASAPAVAGQTMYVVTRDGVLHAYR